MNFMFFIIGEILYKFILMKIAHHIPAPMKARIRTIQKALLYPIKCSFQIFKRGDRYKIETMLKRWCIFCITIFSGLAYFKVSEYGTVGYIALALLFLSTSIKPEIHNQRTLVLYVLKSSKLDTVMAALMTYLILIRYVMPETLCIILSIIGAPLIITAFALLPRIIVGGITKLCNDKDFEKASHEVFSKTPHEVLEDYMINKTFTE